MKDYLGEFKKQRVRKNVAIVIFSLAFAIGINSFLFGTNVGNKLQTSVKNYSSEKVNPNADIYLENSGTGGDTINLNIGTKMNEVSRITFSLISDPEKVTINDITSEDNNIEIIKSSSVPGIFMVQINFKTTKNLTEKDNLLKIVYTKKSPEKVNINLVETKFQSKGNEYELQSSGVEF